MKTIYFANHAQFEGKYTNLGDWAIFEQMIGQLTPYIKQKECKVVVASSEPEFTSEHYPVISFQRGGIKGIFNTLKWLWKSDIVVIGGGEIVQDLSSMVYIPYQLIRPFIGKLFGKKLFAYAIGIGEEWEISKIGKLQAKIVLNMFDVITVREHKSLRVLKDYLHVKKPNIYLTADPALNLNKRHGNINVASSPFVVMSVRSVYHRTRSVLPFSIRKKLKLIPKQYYVEIELFKKEIAKIASEIVKKYNLNIIFLNTYTGKSMSANDDLFSLDVISKIPHNIRHKVSIIDEVLFPSEIKQILADSKLIMSVPLHPLILGASENVPVISFAYASKSICFMNEIDMFEYIHEVVRIGDRLKTNKVMDQIEYIMSNYENVRKEISQKLCGLKNREEKNIELLLDLAGIGNINEK